MGCKINKRSPNVEDSIQDVNAGAPNLIKPTNNEAQSNPEVGIQPPPVITNEKDVRFKASELVGEKKGNILEHYVFEKDLGAGDYYFFYSTPPFPNTHFFFPRCLWSSKKGQA